MLIERPYGRLQFRHNGSQPAQMSRIWLEDKTHGFFGQFFTGSMCITCGERKKSPYYNTRDRYLFNHTKNQKKKENHTHHSNKIMLYIDCHAISTSPQQTLTKLIVFVSQQLLSLPSSSHRMVLTVVQSHNGYSLVTTNHNPAHS